MTVDPTMPDAGVDFAVCGMNSGTLTGNVITDGVGEWLVHSGPNTPVITDVNDESSSITGLKLC